MKRITVKWAVLGVVGAVWIAFTATWAIGFVPVKPGDSKAYEVTRFVFLSISAFGVLFSSLLASFNALEATANLQDKLNFDRMENAFGYMARWDAASLKDARDWTRKMKAQSKKLAPDTLIERIEGLDPSDIATYQKDDLKRSVIAIVNFFEEIYLSIKADRVKADVLKQAFGFTYCDIYERFKSWIEKQCDPEQQKNLKQLNTLWS